MSLLLPCAIPSAISARLRVLEAYNETLKAENETLKRRLVAAEAHAAQETARAEEAIAKFAALTERLLLFPVIKAESAFDRLAVSPKGALGLMQLMPQTAAQHQVRNVFLPRDNIAGGVRHLRLLLDRYGGNLPLTIAAYNAGTQRVEDAGGIPPIPETREYLARVLRYRLAYLREAPGVLAASR